jgi:hypothetical protein
MAIGFAQGAKGTVEVLPASTDHGRRVAPVRTPP